MKTKKKWCTKNTKLQFQLISNAEIFYAHKASVDSKTWLYVS